MGFNRNLKLSLFPLRMTDPDFGNLVFVNMPPAEPGWEAERAFPATRTAVLITLRGGDSVPLSQERNFYLSLPARFDSIMAACRPLLNEVLSERRGSQLPDDVFSAIKLNGFGVEDALAEPVRWDVAFETIDNKPLAIRIPFVGNSAQAAQVDS